MTDAIYGAGRVGQLAVKLFNAEKFNRMLDCDTVADAEKVLVENGWGGTTANPDDFESILSAELVSATQFLKELTSDKAATDCFLTSFDYCNAKIFAKCKYMRCDAPCAYAVGLLDKDELQKDILSDDYERLSPFMRGALEKIDVEFFNGNRTGETVDRLLDKAKYAEIFKTLKASHTQSVKDYFKIEADCLNVQLMFRCKRADMSNEDYASYFVEGAADNKNLLCEVYAEPVEKWLSLYGDGEYAGYLAVGVEAYLAGKSLYVLEQEAEKKKIALLAPNKNELTLEPLVCWYLSKCREIDDVRMILVGKSCSIDKKKIAERLKGLYV